MSLNDATSPILLASLSFLSLTGCNTVHGNSTLRDSEPSSNDAATTSTDSSADSTPTEWNKFWCKRQGAGASPSEFFVKITLGSAQVAVIKGAVGGTTTLGTIVDPSTDPVTVTGFAKDPFWTPAQPGSILQIQRIIMTGADGTMTVLQGASDPSGVAYACTAYQSS